MRILHLSQEPYSSLTYLNAKPGGGGTMLSSLPILRGTVDELSPAIDGLLLASDLQGMFTTEDRSLLLLGCALSAEYLELSARDHTLPSPERTGVILAGDLYSHPAANVRGATGDVRAVWWSFADHFAFVAGVAGNHDLYGTPKERRRFESEPHIHLFDGTVGEIAGMKIGGVSGIIGDPQKNERKREEHFLELLSNVCALNPEVVVLHQGPDGGESKLRGSTAVRELLASAPPALTVCGHAHWMRPLAEPHAGRQFLNVDGRAVLLMRASG